MMVETIPFTIDHTWTVCVHILPTEYAKLSPKRKHMEVEVHLQPKPSVKVDQGKNYLACWCQV